MINDGRYEVKYEVHPSADLKELIEIQSAKDWQYFSESTPIGNGKEVKSGFRKLRPGSWGASIGILAYGSLINDPGIEFNPLICQRIPIRTPFGVEFARSSEGRSGAPTLVPVLGTSEVDAVLLILKAPIGIQDVRNMLWRRETRKPGNYAEPAEPTQNSVLVREMSKLVPDLDLAVYTVIGANIAEENRNPKYLAGLAVASAEARTDGRDGISYLINAKRAGIVTALTEEYTKEILRMTKTTTLEEALESLRVDEC